METNASKSTKQPNNPSKPMNILTNDVYTLHYRFSGESEIRELKGTQAEIQAFVNDFEWADVNRLFGKDKLYMSHGQKHVLKHAIAPMKPSNPFSYHIIWPVQPEQPATDKQPEQIKLPTNKLAKTIKQQFDILRPKKNREHEKCFIVLNPQTTVTCLETGISFSVELPMPQGINLECIHPLSYFDNVQQTIRAYSNKGIRLESELSHQVLAGMLLTILRHKKLLVCQDFVQANICLQKAKKDTLSFCVRYFNGIVSSISMPQLHIIPEALYDFYHAPITLSKEQIISDRIELMLQNYIKVCRGEVESETRVAGTIIKKQEQQTNIRKSGGNIDIEARQAIAREKLGHKLLEKLEQQFPVPQVSALFYDMVRNKLDAFMYLGTEQRQKIAKEILAKFGESKHGKELATIFATTKTETMELSLTNFSQEIQKDLEGWKGQKRKFNLLAQLVTKKEGE